MTLDWNLLLNTSRRKDKVEGRKNLDSDDVRTELERDHDRILFSTPFRRMGDKTQVFPLDPNYSIRTRLTHSLEVANLARSIGINIAFNKNIIPDELNPKRNVPAILAAAGLVHDLGNPPFGHQGEETIREWFRRKDAIDSGDPIFSSNHAITESQKQDFLKFDGNSQTLRLLTRLQVLSDEYGLNLTYATLATLMKYTTDSEKANKKSSIAATTKHGFFQSEKSIVEEVWGQTGLSEGLRHPLTYIMEACDDIAYSVMDTEDSVKKGLVSFSDVIDFLKHHADQDKNILDVIKYASEKHKKYRRPGISPMELNDISMQMFRVKAIGIMVKDLSDAFESNIKEIMTGKFGKNLIQASKSSKLCELLQDFCFQHAFKHRAVKEIELRGNNIVTELMNFLWEAIVTREDTNDLGSNRSSPFARYVYSRISENYRNIAEKSGGFPIRYKEAQLLTDMVSGMTDSFAITFYNEIREYHAGHLTS